MKMELRKRLYILEIVDIKILQNITKLTKSQQMKENQDISNSNNGNWGKSGIFTAGFWSRWMLWNKPTLEESYNDIKK